MVKKTSLFPQLEKPSLSTSNPKRNFGFAPSVPKIGKEEQIAPPPSVTTPSPNDQVGANSSRTTTSDTSATTLSTTPVTTAIPTANPFTENSSTADKQDNSDEKFSQNYFGGPPLPALTILSSTTEVATIEQADEDVSHSETPEQINLLNVRQTAYTPDYVGQGDANGFVDVVALLQAHKNDEENEVGDRIEEDTVEVSQKSNDSEVTPSHVKIDTAAKAATRSASNPETFSVTQKTSLDTTSSATPTAAYVTNKNGTFLHTTNYTPTKLVAGGKPLTQDLRLKKPVKENATKTAEVETQTALYRPFNDKLIDELAHFRINRYTQDKVLAHNPQIINQAQFIRVMADKVISQHKQTDALARQVQKKKLVLAKQQKYLKLISGKAELAQVYLHKGHPQSVLKNPYVHGYRSSSEDQQPLVAMPTFQGRLSPLEQSLLATAQQPLPLRNVDLNFHPDAVNRATDLNTAHSTNTTFIPTNQWRAYKVNYDIDEYGNYKSPKVIKSRAEQEKEKRHNQQNAARDDLRRRLLIAKGNLREDQEGDNSFIAQSTFVRKEYGKKPPSLLRVLYTDISREFFMTIILGLLNLILIGMIVYTTTKSTTYYTIYNQLLVEHRKLEENNRILALELEALTAHKTLTRKVETFPELKKIQPDQSKIIIVPVKPLDNEQKP